MYKFFSFFIFTVLLNSCMGYKYSKIHLYSKDKTQVVSIFTNSNYTRRIIAHGKHNKPPKNNYYLLDITKISKLGDEIGVCWKSNKYEWEIVNNNAVIIESHIDENKFILRTEWFKDDKLIPTPRYYRKFNCFTVGMGKYDTYHVPEENGHVVRF